VTLFTISENPAIGGAADATEKTGREDSSPTVNRIAMNDRDVAWDVNIALCIRTLMPPSLCLRMFRK
jgi:hypothetical protein